MTHKTMAELEAENVEGFINPKRTPQEWKELEERNKAVYEKIIKIKEKEMSSAVKELDFETAAILRDEIGVLRERMEK